MFADSFQAVPVPLSPGEADKKPQMTSPLEQMGS